MGRVTRAKAAEVAETPHIDEDAVLDANENDVAEAGGAVKQTDEATHSKDERSPLGEITPNSADGVSEVAPQEEEAPKKKSKSKKKKNKGKKNAALGASTTSEVTEQEDAQPEAEPTVNEEEVPTNRDLSEPTDTPAGRATRAQLAKLAETEVSNADTLVTEESHVSSVANDVSAQIDGSIEQDQSEQITPDAPMKSALDASAPTLLSETPQDVSSLQEDTPENHLASNEENVEPTESREIATPARSSTVSRPSYDALEAAAIDAVTPPLSQKTSPMGPEMDRQESGAKEPAEALDEINEALQNVRLQPEMLPAASGESDELDTKENPEPTDAAVTEPVESEQLKEVTNEASSEKPKPKAKKVAPVVRGTKASQARLSMATSEKSNNAPALGRPRMSTALGRSNSVKQSQAPLHTRGLSVSTRAAPDAVLKGKKEAVIPHSKPRPVSISFPTPPPVVRSTKAPTKSSFQLPGEAIAAKLKAQREERAKKEAEEAKRPAFKARPAPSMSKTAPVVRHTNASKFRESALNRNNDSKTSTSRPASVAHKRSSSVFTSSTTRAMAPKSTTGERISARPSTAMATVHKSRGSISVAKAITAPASGQRVPSGKGTEKGKAVFNRAANAREMAEKEKREKEEAAKKARAAAAERGRQLSREWAEKQRQKKLAQKTVEGSSPAPPVVPEVAAT
ncbi:Hypothetical protein R9X50_00395700 [Acrodontium crateriforme]|uniref:Carboxylesterase family protein n=1 Tax=Acrodontium crateriforme TaxID=150365 RepID=A0AAQ3M3H3_9PEZI|nr:Hypothetical protein R9X50_00395700 [Acrodontium crateriforme]